MTDPTYELVEFRFENDDGDENTRTFAAALNTTLDLQTGTSNKKSIRVQILNDNAKVSNVIWAWEYNNTTQVTGWVDITTTSSHIQAVASDDAGVVEGDTLTNNLTTRGAFDPDGNITVDGVGSTYNHAASDYAENSLVFYVVDGDVDDGDAIQIRPYSSGDGWVVTYTNTPNITVDKPLVDPAPNISDDATATDSVTVSVSDPQVSVSDSATAADSVGVSVPTAGELDVNITDNQVARSCWPSGGLIRTLTH
jgi:hypothetical protein